MNPYIFDDVLVPESPPTFHDTIEHTAANETDTNHDDLICNELSNEVPGTHENEHYYSLRIDPHPQCSRDDLKNNNNDYQNSVQPITSASNELFSLVPLSETPPLHRGSTFSYGDPFPAKVVDRETSLKRIKKIIHRNHFSKLVPPQMKYYSQYRIRHSMNTQYLRAIPARTQTMNKARPIQQSPTIMKNRRTKSSQAYLLHTKCLI